MDRIKILAIAPYEGLREVLLAEAANRSDIEMDVYLGDLADGVSMVKALENNGYDVILSRGGTAKQIERVTHLPVVDIVPSVYDLLRYVRLAENMPGRFAVVGFPNITRIADKLFDLIQRNIEIVTLQEASDADPAVDRLIREGFTLIVGDAIAVATAKKRHMNSILIASGEESVQSALLEAVRLNRVLNAAMARNLLYRDILDKSRLGIVVFDKSQKMLYSNLSQSRMEYQRVFRSLPKYVAPTLQRGEFQITRRARGYLFEILGRRFPQPGDERVVFYIQRKLSLPQPKEGAVEYCHMLDATQEETHLPIDNIGRMAPVMDAARRLGQTSSPVCVTGSAGVPFDAVIHALYRESPLNSHPLIMIDCALIDEKSFCWLLDNADSPLCEARVTICLKRFSALSHASQLQYVRFARCTSLHKRNRLLYTLPAPFELSDAAADFFNDPDQVLLCLPKLCERAEDIVPLASLYLSAVNLEVGRQVIGFTEEARLLLEAYGWPGNNDQLRRVIKRCLLCSQHERITALNVRESLCEEKRFWRDDGARGIDLSGTLEEITVRIVGTVLKEENMNRSKTAERLGISRSTLWRMMK